MSALGWPPSSSSSSASSLTNADVSRHSTLNSRNTQNSTSSLFCAFCDFCVDRRGWIVLSNRRLPPHAADEERAEAFQVQRRLLRLPHRLHQRGEREQLLADQSDD